MRVRGIYPEVLWSPRPEAPILKTFLSESIAKHFEGSSNGGSVLGWMPKPQDNTNVILMQSALALQTLIHECYRGKRCGGIMGCICANIYFIFSDLCRTRRKDGPQQLYVTPVGAWAL